MEKIFEKIKIIILFIEKVIKAIWIVILPLVANLIRFLIIFIIGVYGFMLIQSWFPKSDIGDVPFSQLTLNNIFASILNFGFSTVFIVVCVMWLFSKKRSSSYEDWVSYLFLIIGAFFLLSRLFH